MKLREFLDGVDIARCGSGRYCDISNAPICPLGHAAAQRGFEFERYASMFGDHIAAEFQLNRHAVWEFARTWDRENGPGNWNTRTQRERFQVAMAAASMYEAVE